MRLEKGWVGRCYVPRPAFAFWIREYIRRCSGVQHVTTYVRITCASVRQKVLLWVVRTCVRSTYVRTYLRTVKSSSS